MLNSKSRNKHLSFSFERPNNTTAYADGDVVCNSTSDPVLASFDVGDCKSQYIDIKSVILKTDKKSINPVFRVHFFSEAIDAISDNLPYNVIYSQKESYYGYAELPAMSTPADTTNSNISIAFSHSVQKALKADSNKKIYAIIETKTVFTPSANQKFLLQIVYEPNEHINRIEYNYVRS